MKIRNGFVSNSSSSSFYIQKPDRHLALEEISGYYKINPELPEETRVWLTLLVWKILNEQEKYDSNAVRDWEYPNDFRSTEGLDFYLSDDNINWMQGNDYFRKDPEYWTNAKKLLDDPEKILHLDLSTSSCDNELDELEIRIPFNALYSLRGYAEKAFLDPSKALGISE